MKRIPWALLLLALLALASSPQSTDPAPAYEIREAGGIPYLFMNGLPYFTRFQQTDHEILNLAGDWKFLPDPDDRGRAEAWFREELDDSAWKIHPLPGSWQAVFPELREYLGAGWYRRTFTPSAGPGKFSRLVLDGAGFHTQVWLNGEEIGRHDGNYSRWSLDLTGRLIPGRPNTLVVRVDNRLGYSDVPPKLWPAARLGWWEYAGIAREAVIESSPTATLSKLAVIAEPLPDGSGSIRLEGLVFNAADQPQTADLAVTLSDPDQQTVLLFPAQTLDLPARGVAPFRLEGKISRVNAWSPETPDHRYRLVVRVGQAGGAERQALEIGFKKFEVRGNSLYLNGRPYYIRGINRHEDDPATGLYQTDARLDEDLALLRELHVNHLRLGHYPNAPRTLDRMDRSGFTICEEIPLYQAGSGFTKVLEKFLFGGGEKGPATESEKSAWRTLHQQADPRLIANAVQQMLETIERDRNHPSLVMWSVGNENMTLSLFPSSAKMHAAVIAAVRRFDPSRPVTFAVITAPQGLSPRFEGAAGLADVISVNEYFGWYYGEMQQLGPYLDRVHRKWPNKPILLSEFGADAFPGNVVGESAPHEKFTEDYQADMLAHAWREIRAREFMVGGMPWIFADFRCGWTGEMHPTHHMNEKGVVSHDRSRRKLGFFTLRQIYAELEAEGK